MMPRGFSMAAFRPLLGLLLAATPALASTRLDVVSDPPGARIYLNGVPVDNAPVTLTNLPAGAHVFAARMPGHREARAAVHLQPGQRRTLDLRLDPLTGLLLIRSTPPDAEIAIDGAYRGRTPLLVTDLPAGSYRASASSPGYLPMEIDINVEDRIPRLIEVNLRSDSARLVFESTPPGARVFVDGTAHGVTPCEVDRIPSGERTVEIRLDGHRPFRHVYTLQAGDVHGVAVELDPLPGSMRLTSIPDGARIYVNGEPRGQTPLTLENLASGEYEARAEARGYASASATLGVRRGAVAIHEFRLERDSGTLVLTTEPAGVLVLIDGEAAGVTAPGESDVLSQPLTIDLVPRGVRRLQLSRQGYYPFETRFAIEAGRTVTRHERLRRRFIPDTRVRIGEGPGDVLTGIISQRFPNGDIEIETRPGIFRTITRQQILAIEPLTVRPPE